jgi:hypothetical protein
MPVSRRLALAVQTLLVALVVTTSALAAPDDEQAKARKDLKKNAKRLAQVDQALAEKQQQLEQVLGASKLDEARQRALEQELVQLRDVGGGLIGSMALANDEDAAELLVAFAVGTRSDDLYGRVASELARLSSDDAIAWLAGTLGAGVADGEGKRGRGGRGRADPDAWKAQVLAARAFEGISSEAAVPPLAAQLERGTTPEVVNACVKTAARKQDKRIVAALIACLGRVERLGGWEYHQVRQALVDLTGEDFFTQERWQGWWTQQEATFDFTRRGEAREAATRERGAEEKVPTFFGSEVASNRVCFIIDTSGSMAITDRPLEHVLSEEEFAKADLNSPALKVFKRIERAKKALVEVVRALQPTQQFNIIAFSDANRPWKQGIVQATEANKAEAVAFVEGLREQGGTNTFASLEAAFRDPLIDTIYLLSDGAPMVKVAGSNDQLMLFAREEVRRILDLVRRENRFRGLKIYTFGMDGPGVGQTPDPEWLAILSNFMRELASVTGGVFKSI